MGPAGSPAILRPNELERPLAGALQNLAVPRGLVVEDDRGEIGVFHVRGQAHRRDVGPGGAPAWYSTGRNTRLPFPSVS